MSDEVATVNTDEMGTIPPKLAEMLSEVKQAIWFRIGALRENLNDRDAALAAFEKVLTHNPSHAVACARAGALLMKKACYPQAIQHLHRSVSVNPENPTAWVALAHSYLMSDDLHNAYQAYQTALGKLPNQNDPSLWVGIGIVHDRFGLLNNAIEAFQAVFNMSPNFERADELSLAMGLILKEQNKYDMAHDCMRRIVDMKLQDQPAYAEALYQIGHIHEVSGNSTAAREAYQSLMSQIPDHIKCLQSLSWLTHKSGRYDEAIALLQRASQIEPNNALSHYLIGRMSMSASDYRVAYDSYQQAVFRDGSNADFWCAIGVLYFHMRQHRDAMDAYTCAIRINADLPEVWYDMGTLYEIYNQYNDAVDAYGRVLQIRPDDVTTTRRLQIVQQALSSGVTPPPADAVPRYDGPEVSPRRIAANGKNGNKRCDLLLASLRTNRIREFTVPNLRADASQRRPNAEPDSDPTTLSKGEIAEKPTAVEHGSETLSKAEAAEPNRVNEKKSSQSRLANGETSKRRRPDERIPMANKIMNGDVPEFHSTAGHKPNGTSGGNGDLVDHRRGIVEKNGPDGQNGR